MWNGFILATSEKMLEKAMQNNEFKTYHPIVNFTYFLFVIGFSCVFMNPVALFISLVSSFIYSVMLKGKKTIKKNLIYMLPMTILIALINPLFNHQGVTILYYLPSGNPMTLESVIYGILVSVMIFSVICWFSCYNEIMTSDKFIYLFGKIIPSLSLVFSMTLRFVPRFTEHLKVVINAQKCLGKDISSGNIIKRARNLISILSIMITWALENSIDTADSMKSRGYGDPNRTSFSIYTFNKRNTLSLLFILILGIYVLIGGFFGGFDFIYFPSIKMTSFSFYSISCYISYTLLCIYPITINVKEEIRWKYLMQKI